MQVVELGQVGKAVSAPGAAADFFVHSQRGSSYGDADPLEHAFSAAAAATSSIKVPTPPHHWNTSHTAELCCGSGQSQKTISGHGSLHEFDARWSCLCEAGVQRPCDPLS